MQTTFKRQVPWTLKVKCVILVRIPFNMCVCPLIGLAVAHRGSGRVPQEVFGDSAECAATDQSSPG